jgi:hypothetical protein
MTDAPDFDLDATLAKFAPGTSWRSKVLCGSAVGSRIHVRGVVDDQIVYRWWRYHKQRWQYQVESAWAFWYYDQRGDI